MIYAGKENAVVELVDVSQIVEEMLELLKVPVSKHAVVEANLGKDLPPTRANAAQLRQIVMNLVTNASDALGDKNGVIGVATSQVKVVASWTTPFIRLRQTLLEAVAEWSELRSSQLIQKLNPGEA
jgi:two-component system, cell cycle sensor histidine kinase and response regulator CckA